MHTAMLSQAFARKSQALLAGAALAVALSSTGCSGMSHTDQGLLGGAAVGGILGTAVGAVAHHPLAGAAIGAASGAAVGGLAGAAEDHAEHRAAVQQAVAEQQRRALTLYDVAVLTSQGTADLTIINQIRASGAVYSLTAADIMYLQQNRVSDAVIQEMQATAMRPAPVIYRGPPVERVYVVDPCPPPPVVGVGVRFGHRW
jgi:osmotically inducible lipoprotein OsmB